MTLSPFPRLHAAQDRSLQPVGVDLNLCRELLMLVEHDPERVAEQVRAWLAEEGA